MIEYEPKIQHNEVIFYAKERNKTNKRLKIQKKQFYQAILCLENVLVYSKELINVIILVRVFELDLSD